MQLSTLLSSTALFATALAYQVNLTATAVRNNKDIEEAGLSGVHEGAGINYIQLGGSGQTLEFDEQSGLIYQQESGFNYTLSVAPNSRTYHGFPFLQLSVLEPNVQWSVDDEGRLVGDSASCVKFYAATNVSDPYNYGAYFVGYGEGSAFKDSGVQNLTRIDIYVNEV